MSQYFSIHPQNPQPRLIQQSVAILRTGGVIAYPTDSSYALGCCIGDKAAMERVSRIRQIDHNRHNFTLVCQDLSEISLYAKLENTAFRLVKALTPGAYTFILQATHEVPRRLQNPRKKTIGARIPDHPIVHALIAALGEPVLSSTLILPGQELPETDPEEIRDKLGKQIDLVIDGGNCGFEPTTVVDLTGPQPLVTRQGKGRSEVFGG
jgi:tRNA threonylcarbamoyl adenosine modification protein (Sua5/YciO/YrdC/YwlC family)